MSNDSEKPPLLALPRFRIKRAAMADVQEMARLQIDCWQEAYRGIIDDRYLDRMSFDRHAAMWAHAINSGSAAFIAELNGEIVGIANGGRRRQGRVFAQGGELYVLYVRRQAHKNGIGRALFDAVQLHLATEGHADLLVQCLRANIACSFYEHLGGIEIGHVNVEVGKQFLEETIYKWTD